MDIDKEFQVVCSLVNSAYDDEAKVPFKKTKRFHNPSREDPRLIQTLKETWVVEKEEEIVGCVR